MVTPRVSEGAVAERGDAFVEARTDPTHFGLRDPGIDTHRGDEVIDGAGRDPVDVGLHHHRIQGLIDPPARCEYLRKERPFRNAGIPRARSPAFVEGTRGRCPLRCVVRPSARSHAPAPKRAVASTPINCWSAQRASSRTRSVPSPTLSASSSAERLPHGGPKPHHAKGLIRPRQTHAPHGGLTSSTRPCQQGRWSIQLERDAQECRDGDDQTHRQPCQAAESGLREAPGVAAVLGIRFGPLHGGHLARGIELSNHAGTSTPARQVVPTRTMITGAGAAGPGGHGTRPGCSGRGVDEAGRRTHRAGWRALDGPASSIRGLPANRQPKPVCAISGRGTA